MSKLLYTVDNLVSEVRQQLDEQNRDSVNNELDILPCLNRAQDYAFDILARRYKEPILRHADMSLVGGQAEYDLPEDIFEDRLLKMEIRIPSGDGARATFREIDRISYSDLTDYESASQTNVPYYYCLFGRTIRFVPSPTGTYGVRYWSLRDPEKLVLEQGRITRVQAAQQYVIVDQIGSSLVTEADQLGSYVNVIDGQTGEIKGTLQVQNITDNRVAFRTVPQRSTVLNRTISAGMSGLEIEEDDYLCAVDGICVPYYRTPTTNFLIQFAVAEITRKLGGQADAEEKILDKFEKQLERTWTGRETFLRVKKKSPIYGRNIRRAYRNY